MGAGDRGRLDFEQDRTVKNLKEFISKGPEKRAAPAQEKPRVGPLEEAPAVRRMTKSGEGGNRH